MPSDSPEIMSARVRIGKAVAAFLLSESDSQIQKRKEMILV